MVRANELTQAELDYSLEIQRRTGRRLGEILQRLQISRLMVCGILRSCKPPRPYTNSFYGNPANIRFRNKIRMR